jgi:hypothetical protein
MSAVVALLILNFVDEHLNHAALFAGNDEHIFSSGQIIWLGNYEPRTNRYFCGRAPAKA